MKIDWESKCINDDGDTLIVVIYCAGEEVWRRTLPANSMRASEAEDYVAKIFAITYSYHINQSGCFN